MPPGRKRAVAQIDANTGAIVEVYSSGLAAEEATFIKQPNIIACCKGRLTAAGGFKWPTEEPRAPEGIVEMVDSRNGSILDSFSSVTEAASTLGIGWSVLTRTLAAGNEYTNLDRGYFLRMEKRDE